MSASGLNKPERESTGARVASLTLQRAADPSMAGATWTGSAHMLRAAFSVT